MKHLAKRFFLVLVAGGAEPGGGGGEDELGGGARAAETEVTRTVVWILTRSVMCRQAAQRAADRERREKHRQLEEERERVR